MRPTTNSLKVVLLIAVCLACALFWRAVGPGIPDEDLPGRAISAQFAQSLLEQHAFADPFPAVPTGPSALIPPLYPLFLALLQRLAGDNAPTVFLLLGFTSIALQPILLGAVSRILFATPIPGWAGSLLTALCCAVQVRSSSSAVFDFDFVLAFLLLAHWTARQGRSSILPGFAAGFLILWNPLLVLIAVPFVWWSFQSVIRKSYKRLFLAGLLLPLAPWSIRNAVELHAFIPVQDGLGLEFGTAFQDCARSSLSETWRNGCLAKTHPTYSPQENKELAHIGEMAYSQKRAFQGLQWIQSHPTAAARLTCDRINAFWFPQRSPGLWLLVLLGGGGAILLLNRRHDALLPMAVSAVVYPLAGYLSLSKEADIVPLLGLISLSTGYFVVAVVCPRIYSVQGTASTPTANAPALDQVLCPLD